jgi:hypothetical protein
VDTLEDAVVSGTRTTRLRISSRRKVPEVILTIFGPERVLSVAVDGREMSDTEGTLTLHFDVFPRSGSIELTIKTTPDGVLGARINHPAARPQGIAEMDPQKDKISLRQERRVLNKIMPKV